VAADARRAEVTNDTRFATGRLIELLKRDALKIGAFTLPSGRTSHYYVDARRVTLSSEGAAMAGTAVVEHLKDFPDVTAVGGPIIGADPIVGAALAWSMMQWRDRRLAGFLVREVAKGHGTLKLIEGPIEPRSRVLIVDDVATTGESSLRAVDAVLGIGCSVAGVLVVLDRLEGAAEVFARRGIDFRSLATIRDLGVAPLEGP
jgi:orotate phosphoribosyltransferase